jgi:hypothetical protein
MDRRRRQIGRDLNDPNRFLRQGEDVAELREADAPQQRLAMKSVGDDHQWLKRIRHAKRPLVHGGNKDRQAMVAGSAKRDRRAGRQARGHPIELKHLARRAAEQLQAAGTDKRS